VPATNITPTPSSAPHPIASYKRLNSEVNTQEHKLMGMSTKNNNELHDIMHLLVNVAPLLNDSFMCGGMKYADRSKEVWPRTSAFL
jgi:hypothetical protein